MEMTDEELRESARNNYAAQMEMLGYEPNGNPKDMVEVVRCKDCKYFPSAPQYEPSCWKHRRRGDDPDWFCADGERR